ncbi:MAG: hypothetical protein HQ471_00420 [Flavobacteriales bacterium]|nr:hypothetical protein [Flavobacteriales bacterium]
MAVPNTTTFDLQTVVNVVNPTSDDLTDCFADAIANKFDPTYSGSKNNLLNFRNYDAGISNTLTVTTASIGFPAIYLALVGNESVTNQVVTFTWKYVSESGDIPPTVKYAGVSRSIGYTTPSITGNINDGLGAFGQPFALIGGNATTLIFEFTLVTAATDTVPSSPNNKTSVSFDWGY